jgi:hypothetical protein
VVVVVMMMTTTMILQDAAPAQFANSVHYFSPKSDSKEGMY